MARTRFHERLSAFGVTAVIGVMGAGAVARSCAPPTPKAPATKATKAPKVAVSAPLPVAGAVVNLVNQQRAAAGIAPLAENALLDAAAIGQASDQATRQTMTHVGSNFQFRSPTGDCRITPKRSAGRRKRQPQERQHGADAGTAAGRGTDCSRETG